MLDVLAVPLNPELMTEEDVRVFLVDFQVPEVVFFLVVVIVVPVLTAQAAESSLKPVRALTHAQLPTGRLPYQRRLTGWKEELCVHVLTPRTCRELRAPVPGVGNGTSRFWMHGSGIGREYGRAVAPSVGAHP